VIECRVVDAPERAV
jgi:hypothetical protein